MSYHRVLLITDLNRDCRTELAMIRRVAPGAELLVVVARFPTRPPDWLSSAAPDDLPEAAAAPVASLRAAAAGAAEAVEVKLASALDAGDLDELAAASRIDLVVVSPLPLNDIRIVAQLRERRSLAVLWTASAAVPDRPITELVCVALTRNAGFAIQQFLRDHGNPGIHARVLLPASRTPRDLLTLDVTGVTARAECVTVTPTSRRSWITEATGDRGIDLLVLPRFPGALLRAVSWPAPVLILPPVASGAPPLRREIDVADPVHDGDRTRARFDYALGVGRREPMPDQKIGFVSSGRLVGVATIQHGEAEVPPGLETSSFGVFRVADHEAADPLTEIEQQITVIRPGQRPLVLFDSGLGDENLRLLGRLGGPDAPDLLAVRMRPMHTCASIRARLSGAGIPPRVADASAVLDEGAALDVPEAVDPVRLARVGARMRGAGFPVAAIVYQGPHRPKTIGFVAVRPDQVAATHWRFDPLPGGARSLTARLDATTGAAIVTGNQVEIELDNGTARRWLLEAIAQARERIHFQIYMAADDDVGRAVESALAAAGDRGVKVRVVVDSLHGLQGSFGLHNPLLSRLGARPGVELRVSRPITSLPSLEDVKQRDHRKLAIVDGTRALLGGRNLSHEYYTGFDEVRLTAQSLWREVPWLDAGARVTGPAVAALERSFLDAWTLADGPPFKIDETTPVGSSSVRVVVHHGLRDACTLDAYIGLIETAKSHVYAVNGFPLILEMQHALLRAIQRGIRVRTLFGNLTPTHGDRPFGGPWSKARVAATELVHSRMDALVAAGGEAHQFAVPELPGQLPDFGVLRPHVHAKVMSVDGRVCAVGSANLDITAGYWENELMLLVEDPSVAGALERRIDELIQRSDRVDPDDPKWQRTARRRDWMRRWPGLLSV